MRRSATMDTPSTWIFDLEGALVDTRALHVQALRRALDETAVPVPADALACGIDMPLHALVRRVARRPVDAQELAAVAQRKREVYLELCSLGIRPMAGASELLGWLGQRSIRRVTIGTDREETLATLEFARMSGLVDTVLDGVGEHEELPHEKILGAMRTLRCAPAATLLVGTRPLDIAAAAAAGIPVLGLLCGGYSRSDLGGATAIYDDPADLLVLLRAGEDGNGGEGQTEHGVATLP